MAGPRGVGRSSVASWPRRVLIFLIELYRTWVSPMRLPTCRFEPTCSTYAVEALTEYGAFKGGLLSVVRLAKCGPWHKPGYDPIPERRNTGNNGTAGQQLPEELEPNAAKEPNLVVTVRN